MSVLDEHNRQHTYGNSLGPPTSVVGVSAQQSIDAHNRRVHAASSAPPTGTIGPGARPFYQAFLVSAGITVAAAVAAYVVGGIGAVAIGLCGFASAGFAVVFLISALIESAKSVFAGRR